MTEPQARQSTTGQVSSRSQWLEQRVREVDQRLTTSSPDRLGPAGRLLKSAIELSKKQEKQTPTGPTGVVSTERGKRRRDGGSHQPPLMLSVPDV